MAIATAAGAADARPKRRDAKTQFDRGVAAYQKGNFEAASQALGKSFELERDVDTLFAWAQAERKLEHCDKAIELYEKLLTFNLPPANKTAVEQKLAECQAIVAPPPRPEPPPEPPIPPPAPADVAVPPPAPAPAPVASDRPAPAPEVPVVPSRRAWYRDPVALGLLGGGVIAGGVGAGFLVSAQSASNASKTATNYPDSQSFKHTAEQRGLIGDISVGAGGALIAAGVVWIVLHRDPGEQRTVTGWLVPGGGGLAIGGPF